MSVVLDELIKCIDKVRINNTINYIDLEKLIDQFQIQDSDIELLFNELMKFNIKIYPSHSWIAHLQQLIRIIGDKKIITSDKLKQWFDTELVCREAQYKIQNKLMQMGYSVIDEDVKERQNILALLEEDDFENLDSLLATDNFKNELTNAQDVIDKQNNLEYIADYKNNLSKKKSLENLILANQKLVWKFVNKYKKFATSSFDAIDMYQEGLLGMMKAIEKFDLLKENQFSTYAVYWIRQGICRGIDDNSTTIRIPVHKREKIRKYLREKDSLWYFSDFTGNFEQLKSYLDYSEEEIIELEFYKNLANLTSLDVPIGENSDSYLGEFIEDKNLDSPEKIVFRNELQSEIQNILHERLSNREEDVIILRFGFADGECHTLEEIGEVYGVTRERIRQIEAKAIRKLKHNKTRKRLEGFNYD